jgi:hypothetical protein
VRLPETQDRRIDRRMERRIPLAPPRTASNGAGVDACCHQGTLCETVTSYSCLTGCLG